MKLLPGPLRRRGEKNGNGNGTKVPSREGFVEGLPAKQRELAEERERDANRQRTREQLAEIPIATVGWIDERTGAGPFLRGFLYRKVPRGTNWFYTLGSATMFAFLSQAVTGVFLAMYYRPSVTQAYESIQHINNDVFLGQFVHGMHKWGSSVMVILIFAHMGRTFFFGAYKYPRELNWIIGVVLLILTMAMAFTGYLLPFDQRSFWATVVGVNINASGPLLGPYLADFLRGGAEFGATTLSRFYAIHMLLIPGLIAALIGAHLFLVAKLGTTAPPWLTARKARELAKEEI
jgi:menaquinol-cytochrome c reductase cytochrome b subunit